MFTSRSLRTILMLGLAAILAGCVLSKNKATVPDASMREQRLASVPTPPPGKAAIYVFRPDQNVLSPWAFQVRIDGHVVGSIARNTYLRTDIEPGKHQISEENAGMGVSRDSTFNASPGQTTFLLVKISAWTGAPSFVPISEQDSARLLKTYKLSGGGGELGK